MKIMFMGTPDFAKFSLEALYSAREKLNLDICAVVTQPDKPKGRGYVMTPPPVKEFALENNIPVYQPVTLKDGAFDEVLEELSPELIVVVAYGKILPSKIINFPKYGCINVHGSLLPEYRGAAPMQRAIIDGKSITGITTMYMDEGLDTGDMLDVCEVAIEKDDNFGTLHDKMAKAGAQTLLITVSKIIEGTVVRKVQDSSLATYAAKIEKAECKLDFSCSAKVLSDKIRGLSPIPLAFAKLNGEKIVKIEKADFEENSSSLPYGSVIALDENKGVISVATGDGILNITSLKPEGKGLMKASDFIRGRNIKIGDIFN